MYNVTSTSAIAIQNKTHSVNVSMFYRSQIVFEIYWYNYTKTVIEVFWLLLIYNIYIHIYMIYSPYASLHNFTDKL